MHRIHSLPSDNWFLFFICVEFICLQRKVIAKVTAGSDLPLGIRAIVNYMFLILKFLLFVLVFYYFFRSYCSHFFLYFLPFSDKIFRFFNIIKIYEWNRTIAYTVQLIRIIIVVNSGKSSAKCLHYWLLTSIRTKFPSIQSWYIVAEWFIFLNATICSDQRRITSIQRQLVMNELYWN